MRIRFVIRMFGLMIAGLGLAQMATALTVALFWMPPIPNLQGSDFDPASPFGRELVAMLATIASGCIGLLLAMVFYTVGASKDRFFTRREALLLVAMSWLVGAAQAGLPYFAWAYEMRQLDGGASHVFGSFVNCYFEAMSGLTTTGATILPEIQTLPRTLLLWRSATHWIGGLGIIVLFVAVLPMLGVGGKKLFQVEAPGPKSQGVRPRIAETARVLLLIYIGLTALHATLLKLTGMPWFDAINHAFATLATGGFSTRNASAGDPMFTPIAHVIIIAFMFLAGVNFGIYYHLIRGRFDLVRKDPELRTYIAIVVVSSLLVTAMLYGRPIVGMAGQTQQAGLGDAALHGVFQVLTVQTTTGYCTADFNQWSPAARFLLVTLMFVGASAGSTGGGIKVIRCLIAFKVIVAELERAFHPQVVRPVKIGENAVDPELRQGTLVYVIGIVIISAVGGILIMVFEQDSAALAERGVSMNFTTAITASAATLNNIGPGLGWVGAVENYGWFSTPSKILMSLLMALGRLEVYAIAVLFHWRFWSTE